MEDLLSAPEAATFLGVSADRVRTMAADGQLPAAKIGNRWVVHRDALVRRRDLQAGAGRPFAAHNAWALLLLASGEDVDNLEPSVRSRLRRAIAQNGIEKLAPRLGRRAEVHSFDAHPGELRYLLDDPAFVRSGISAAATHGLDLVAGQEADGYLSESSLQKVVEEHALAPAGFDGNVRLRTVPGRAWRFPAGEPIAPIAAVALDLLEDGEPRSKSAGRRALLTLEASSRPASRRQ